LHRHLIEVRSVIGELCFAGAINDLDGGGQCHFAEAVVVAVRLAVGGDMDE
jgi:hypothetical protein